MRAHTQLGLLVHLPGSNLHLHYLALRTDYRCMQRAITVLLRIGNIIIKLVGNIAPQTVDQPQRGVAVADLRNHDTQSTDIIDLGEADTLALHFPPYTVYMLRPSTDLEAYSRLVQ